MLEKDSITQIMEAGVSDSGAPLMQTLTSASAHLPYCDGGFFEGKVGYDTVVPADEMGVAGTPIPYSIANDNYMDAFMLIGFVVILMALASLKGLFVSKAKTLILGKRASADEEHNLTNEVRMQCLMMVVGCVMMSVIFCSLVKPMDVGVMRMEQYQMVALGAVAFLGFFLLKILCYLAVGWTFFGGKKNIQWLNSFVLLTIGEGLVLMPLAYMLMYMELSAENTLIYLAIVVVSFKLLTLYRQRQIFFSANGHLLGFFLYFCAVEIVPLMMMWKLLAMASSFFVINF